MRERTLAVVQGGVAQFRAKHRYLLSLLLEAFIVTDRIASSSKYEHGVEPRSGEPGASINFGID